ncbi:type II toxin-antitoxin system VapC family toxin [Pseudomonas sp. efr-133-TYG-103a]|uniref:type II toxin-antitoxin system VapC family toxin n=1 Tax=Pseudomonas sp. efr-133-TYG-103a TaxID=3040308 RepID=UPI002553AE0B|nr:type II toxin-antitoxin system VapC family toxin [Pseudomonas sp. efr-133-TYG-103a]
MYLLDTNVVSELRKNHRAAPSVMRWARPIPASSLYLSSITVLELETGILRLERHDAAQSKLLRTWLEHHVLPAFAGRILPIDTAVASKCARLHVPDPRSEYDALIAATALVHGMTVVTRNTADFAGSGVALINPWISQLNEDRAPYRV